MAFDVSEKPVISKRTLDDDNVIVIIDTESKSVKIESRIIDEYSTGKKFIQRIPVVLRDERKGNAGYTNAINEILPDDDAVQWTNPRQTFINLIMQVLERELAQ